MQLVKQSGAGRLQAYARYAQNARRVSVSSCIEDAKICMQGLTPHGTHLVTPQICFFQTIFCKVTKLMVGTIRPRSMQASSAACECRGCHADLVHERAWMASVLPPGVADKPSTLNLHLSSRIFLTAITMSLCPLARWHSSTTRHTTFLCGQMPASTLEQCAGLCNI